MTDKIAIKKEMEAIRAGKDIFVRMRENPEFWNRYLDPQLSR